MGCTDSLPIEHDGDSGTAYGHWDDKCLQNELMTGFLDMGIGAENPLSTISIGALEDLGYIVSYDNAEPYSISDINTDYCCFPVMSGNDRQQLRNRRSLKPIVERSKSARAPGKKPVSAETARIAGLQAAKELKFARDNPPPQIPEGLTYIGGDSIKILVFDEYNEIQDITFGWSDVQGLLS